MSRLSPGDFLHDHFYVLGPLSSYLQPLPQTRGQVSSFTNWTRNFSSLSQRPSILFPAPSPTTFASIAPVRHHVCCSCTPFPRPLLCVPWPLPTDVLPVDSAPNYPSLFEVSVGSFPRLPTPLYDTFPGPQFPSPLTIPSRPYLHRVRYGSSILKRDVGGTLRGVPRSVSLCPCLDTQTLP